MKITFLLPHVRLSGGVKVLLEYANRLGTLGHETSVVVPGERIKWHRFDKKFRARRGGAVTLPADTVDWFPNRVPVIRVPRISGQFLPPADVLVASSWETAAAIEGFPESLGRKVYFIQHHECLWTRKKEEARRTYSLPYAKVVVSTWLRDILAGDYGQEALLLVPPVDREVFYCAEKKWNRPRRVCLLHHDYDWKGFAEGIRAVERVRQAGLPLEAVVFGEKIEDPAPLFETAGFPFEYHFRPAGKQLREIYSSCDMFLCPSWYEGLGLPAMEAMACSCALVTTDTGGCRDYAIDRETALVSAPKDVDALAENLTALIRDEALMKRLAVNGQKKIGAFCWEDNCRKLLELFETLGP